MSLAQIAAAAAAAGLAGLTIARRGRLGLERQLLALGVVALLAVYASGVLREIPAPEKLVEDVATSLGRLTYVLVGALAFLETGAFVGLIAPGETVVLLGGVVAGQGEIEIVPLIGLVWACAVLGDTTSFLIGRRLGRAFLMKHGPRVKITPERLEQVEGYLDRHGGKTILVGRFIGLVRALAPFVAGSSRMPYGRFIPYSVIGTGLWAATFSLLGYLFWRSFDRVAEIAGRASLVFGLFVALVVGGIAAHRRLREPQERERLRAWAERQAARPALRPLARLLRPLWRHLLAPAGRAAMPPLRFLRERLTPGQLGVEFTTAVAVAAAGLYVFALYAVVLSGGTDRTPGDRQGLDVAAELRGDLAVDLVKVVTELGSLPLVGALVLVAAAALAWRRRPIEMVALVAGLLLVYVAVQLGKSGIDRPRPEGRLAAVEGQSYPSGHAAYSTAYLALAVVAGRVLPNLASRAGVLLTALAIATAVGLSRIYLQVHYWSDVAGGWALGLGIFGLCGAAALLVGHIRQNGSRPADA